MNKSLYDIIGVEKNTTNEEIKKAFRDKSKKLHPDVNKGNDSEFKEVKEAYDILKDKEKRKIYDETGIIHNKKMEDQINNNIIVLYNIIINKHFDLENLKYINILKEMEDNIKNEIIATKEIKKNINNKKKHIEDLRKRFKSKENLNIFDLASIHQLGDITMKLFELDNKIHQYNIMINRLNKYSFKKAKLKKSNFPPDIANNKLTSYFDFGDIDIKWSKK